jgi:hypothetical protein
MYASKHVAAVYIKSDGQKNNLSNDNYRDTPRAIASKEAAKPKYSTKLVLDFGDHPTTAVTSVGGKDLALSNGLLSNQYVPLTNISRSGKTSRISHSKSEMWSLYFLHSWYCSSRCMLSSGRIFSEGLSSTTGPRPTDISSNEGTFSIRANIWPMAYFSTRNKRAHSGDVMRTCEVATQTTLPEHCKCTCLF